MLIRAVTLFYPVEGGKLNGDELRGELTRLRSAIDKISAKYGVKVRTWRVTLPFIETTWNYRELAETVNRAGSDLGYIHSSINVPMGLRVNLDDLVSTFLKSSSYMSIWVGDFRELDEVNASLFVDVMRRLVELGAWSSARRMAALVGDAILTPYYPDSINLGNRHGVALSILYASDIMVGRDRLIEAMRGVFKRTEEVGKEIAEEVGVDYLGIDVSLSPWGEDSVVRAMEHLFSIRFGGPGTLGAIYELNRGIWEAMTSVRSTGFNEIMLPLAEDEGLKARAREGLITFSKLVAYTATCVAGVDMVPIPAGQVGLVRDLIQDLHAIASVKRRSLGLRLIPYPGNEIEVDVGDFGRTPVMDMMR